MDQLAKYAQELDTYVRTDSFPLGIKVFKQEADIPAKAKRPLRDLQNRITICQGISMARRYGWTLAMGADDLSCPIALTAFGLEPVLPYYEEGTLACGMYVDSPEAGALTEADVPKFSPEESGTIVVGPYCRTACTSRKKVASATRSRTSCATKLSSQRPMRN